MRYASNTQGPACRVQLDGLVARPKEPGDQDAATESKPPRSVALVNLQNHAKLTNWCIRIVVMSHEGKLWTMEGAILLHYLGHPRRDRIYPASLDGMKNSPINHQSPVFWL